jgi:RHS repeat-associated protein
MRGSVAGVVVGAVVMASVLVVAPAAGAVPLSGLDSGWSNDGIAGLAVEAVAKGGPGVPERVFSALESEGRVTITRHNADATVDASYANGGSLDVDLGGAQWGFVEELYASPSGTLIALLATSGGGQVLRISPFGTVLWRASLQSLFPGTYFDGLRVIGWETALEETFLGADVWLSGSSPDYSSAVVAKLNIDSGQPDGSFVGDGSVTLNVRPPVKVVSGGPPGSVVVRDFQVDNSAGFPADVTRLRRLDSNGFWDPLFTTAVFAGGTEVYATPTGYVGIRSAGDPNGRAADGFVSFDFVGPTGARQLFGSRTSPGPEYFDINMVDASTGTIYIANQDQLFAYYANGAPNARFGPDGVVDLPFVPAESRVRLFISGERKAMVRVGESTVRARVAGGAPLAVTRVDRPGTPVGAVFAADPVDTATGNLYDAFLDLSLNVTGLDLSRVYNSGDPGDGTAGPGWRIGTGPSVIPADAGAFTVIEANGTRHTYTADGLGGFAAPAGTSATLSVDPAPAAGDGPLPMLRRTSADGMLDRFDTKGRLIEQLSWDGEWARTSFDVAGNVAEVLSSTGQSLTFTHDTEGRVIEVSASAGNTVSYTYEDGLLASATDQFGATTTFAYTPEGWLQKVTDPTGVVLVDNVFDVSGRVISQVGPDGGTTTFTYIDAEAVTAVWDSVTGTNLYYHHDALGKVTAIVDAYGNREERVYDEQGNPAGSLGRDNAQTIAEYDAHNNLLSSYEEGVGTSLFTYDSRNRVLSFTDPAGATTTFTYSGEDRIPSSITNALGHTATQTVADGLVTSHTDADGVTTTYTYDTSRRPLTVTDGLGNTTTYTYDARGRMTTVTSPSGRVTTRAYTPEGRLLSVTAPDGGASSYTYDAAGRVLTTTDATGAVTTNIYSVDTPQGPKPVDYLVATVDPGGVRTDYRYDGNGQLIETVTAGVSTTTAFGPMGRVDSTTGPLGRISSYTYDAEGQNTSATDPAGAVTRTEYDTAGRVVKTIDAADRETVNTYSPTGRLLSSTAPGAQTTAYEYDLLGRAVKVTDARGGTTTTTFTPGGRTASTTDAAGLVTTYDYDAAGRRVRVTAPGGRTTTTVLNAEGETLSVTSPGGLVTSYTYDPAGRVLTMTDPAGVVTTRSWSLRGEMLTETVGGQGTVRYAYNPNGTLASVTDAVGSSTLFGYDARRNLTRRTNAVGDVDQWSYNDADELVAHTDPLGRTTNYDYDIAGRLERVSDPADQAAAVPTPEVITYNTDGTIATRDDGNGVTTYGYDAAGRVASMSGPDGALSYIYNAAGDVLSETVNGRTTSYTYHVAGRRISMRRPSGESVNYTYNTAGELAAITPGEQMADSFIAENSPNSGRWTVTSTAGSAGDSHGPPNDVDLATTDVPSSSVSMQSKVAASSNTDITFSYQFAAVDPANASKLTAFVRSGTSNHYRVELTPGAAAAAVIQKKGAATTTLGAVATPTDTTQMRIRVQVIGTAVKVKIWDAGVREPDGWALSATGTITTTGTAKLTADRIAGSSSVAIDDWRQSTPGAAVAPLAAYAYNADGQLTGETLIGGTRTRTYTNGRLTEFTENLPGAVVATTFGYDSTGRVVSDTTGAVTTTYTYDAGSQLLSATPTTGTPYVWSYDKLGRRTTEKKGTTTTKFVYDAASQLCWTTTGALAANASCATASASAPKFSYDAAGRLTSEWRSATNQVAYTYDSAGRLTSTKRINGTTTTEATRRYRPDGLIGLAENVRTTATGSTTSKSWIDWDTQAGLPQITGIHQHAGSNVDVVTGPGGWAATRTGVTHRAVAIDAHGSAIPSTGVTVARSSSYTAYGAPASGSDTFDPRLGYRGELTIDSQLYLRARDYQATLGQFTTIDPLEGVIGATTVANPYHYTDNNPLNKVDPTGMRASLLGMVSDREALDAISNGTRIDKLSDNEVQRYLNNPIMRDYLLAHGVVPTLDTVRNPCVVLAVQVRMSCQQARDLGYSTGEGEDEYVSEVFHEWLNEEVKPAALLALTDLFLAWGFAKIAARGGESIWGMSNFERGRAFEVLQGANIVEKNMPVIDSLAGSVGTSLKTLDVTATSYQTTSTLSRTLTKYIDKLRNFQGGIRWGTTEVPVLTGRALVVGIPEGATAAQVSVMTASRAYGASVGVDVTFVIVP